MHWLAREFLFSGQEIATKPILLVTILGDPMGRPYKACPIIAALRYMGLFRYLSLAGVGSTMILTNSKRCLLRAWSFLA